jgi:hypothetical protein
MVSLEIGAASSTIPLIVSALLKVEKRPLRSYALTHPLGKRSIKRLIPLFRIPSIRQLQFPVGASLPTLRVRTLASRRSLNCKKTGTATRRSWTLRADSDEFRNAKGPIPHSRVRASIMPLASRPMIRAANQLKPYKHYIIFEAPCLAVSAKFTPNA